MNLIKVLKNALSLSQQLSWEDKITAKGLFVVIPKIIFFFILPLWGLAIILTIINTIIGRIFDFREDWIYFYIDIPFIIWFFYVSYYLCKSD